jgi:hypothetical protein
VVLQSDVIQTSLAYMCCVHHMFHTGTCVCLVTSSCSIVLEHLLPNTCVCLVVGLYEQLCSLHPLIVPAAGEVLHYCCTSEYRTHPKQDKQDLLMQAVTSFAVACTGTSADIPDIMCALRVRLSAV